MDKGKDKLALILALGGKKKETSTPKPALEPESESNSQLEDLALAWEEAKTKSGTAAARALLNALELAKTCSMEDEEDTSGDYEE